MIKTRLKPITKLRECKNNGRRLLLPAVKISGPARLPRYIGTKGSTQGDKKDNSPAIKAIIGEMFSIPRQQEFGLMA